MGSSGQSANHLPVQWDELIMKLDQLIARMDELIARMDTLIARLDTIQDDISELKGFHLEHYYRTNATAILGLFFRNLRVLDKGRLIDSLYEQRPLSREEWEQILAVDLLVTGRHRTTEKEYLMAWEISWTVDENDVLRAIARADLLRQRWMNALPVVAGKGITGNARSLAEARKVLVVLDSFPVDGTGIMR